MSKLHASFGDPEHGWIILSIRADNQSVEIDASDIYPSFVLLVDALHILHTYQGETTVTWTGEPTEYDLHFQRVGEIITLSVFIHADSFRTVSSHEPVLTVSGNYDEICLSGARCDTYKRDLHRKS